MEERKKQDDDSKILIVVLSGYLFIPFNIFTDFYLLVSMTPKYADVAKMS